MGFETNIEWCDHTFNGWMGCQKVSPACSNCYAENGTVARTMKATGKPLWGGDGASRRVKVRHAWRELLTWNEKARAAQTKRRVFCFSLADVFETQPAGVAVVHYDGCPVFQDPPLEPGQVSNPQALAHWNGTGPGQALTLNHLRLELFQYIAKCEWLDFLLLTKRPGDVRRILTETADCARGQSAVRVWDGLALITKWLNGDPPKNVWLGTTVENQDYLGRIDELKTTGAAILFLSMEPLLGPVPTLGEHLGGIDWVITGGETKAAGRPMHPDWPKGIRDQCQAAGVPFFFKQWGDWKPITEMTEPEMAGYYRPRVPAKSHESQDELDDIHGRAPTVETLGLGYDGSVGKWQSIDGFHTYQIFKTGSAAAGRKLDGVEWSQFPGDPSC